MFALKLLIKYQKFPKGYQLKKVTEKIGQRWMSNVADCEHKNPEEKTKKRKYKRKTLKSEFLPWMKRKENIQFIKTISSFVCNQEEISCVTMNENFTVTDIIVKSFKDSNLKKPSQYYEILKPLVNSMPPVDLHVLEMIHLPHHFKRTSLHLRSATMFLLGALQKNIELVHPSKQSIDYNILQLDRSKMADYCNLTVEGTKTRMDSQNLLFEILTYHRWKNYSINYSKDMIIPSRDKILVGEFDKDGEFQTSLMSQTTKDAIIQSLAFWDICWNIRSAKNN